MTESPAPPPSPCTGICRIDGASGQCIGCRRTLDEIAAWPTLSAEGKRAMLAQLSTRNQPGRSQPGRNQPSGAQ